MDRNYYVLCDSNCKFPSMTTEQILAAIAEATGNTPTNVDDAFITKIREINSSENLTFWIGTSAEFNALPEKTANTLYILTDDTTLEAIEARCESLAIELGATYEIIRGNSQRIEENALAISKYDSRIGLVESDISRCSQQITSVSMRADTNKNNISTIFDAANTLNTKEPAKDDYTLVSYQDEVMLYDNVKAGMYMVRVTHNSSNSHFSFMLDFEGADDRCSCIFQYNTGKGTEKAFVKAESYNGAGLFRLKVISATDESVKSGFSVSVRQIGARYNLG